MIHLLLFFFFIFFSFFFIFFHFFSFFFIFCHFSQHELINIKSKARILKGVPILLTLSEAEREEIARLMKRNVYQKGDQIIKQGEEGDEFFVIETGEGKYFFCFFKKFFFFLFTLYFSNVRELLSLTV